MLSHLSLAFLLTSAASAAVAISPGHPELLQQGILDAYASGQKSVVVPPGLYRIPLPANAFTHLNLQSLKNFEIDARGATFVFQDVTRNGVYFANCDNVTFHGATLYYGTTPFSQGRIQAVAADGSSFDVQIETGYPTNLDDPRYFSPQLIGHLFDGQTRWWKRNVYGDITGARTQRLGPDTFRVFSTAASNATPGDLIGFRSGTGDHLLRVVSSSRMTLQDVTILNSPGFGIVEVLGGDLGPNRYLSITVKRGPRPPGAATDPLFSTNADGFHSLQARIGPDVENCYFESMADDGIAIHGLYSWVMEGSGNTLIVSNTAVAGGANFNVGDPFVLTGAGDDLAEYAVVTAITPLSSYRASRKSARRTVQDYTVGPYYQITLDRPVHADFDYLASNPAANGAGFVLRNNTIRNHRGRGMNLKADNGTVENNLIDGSTMVGIRAGPEFGWAESGYPQNLVLRNNTVSNVGYWGAQAGALVIAPDEVLTAAGNMKNIVIDGNLFQNFDITAIFIASAGEVVLSNNRFQNLQNASPLATYAFGERVSPGTLVFVTRSGGVEFQGNTASQLGPLNSVFVETSPQTAVQGVAYLSLLADSDADFSGTQGTANWSYGYFPSGNTAAFTLLPTYNAPLAQWQHATFGAPWTLLNAHSAHPNGTDSGIEEWATRRWTSTTSGAAEIRGHLAKGEINPLGTGVFGRIYQNHNLVYEHYLGPTDSAGVDYFVPLSLHTGDVLDFAIAPNGTDYFGTAAFTSSVLTVSPNGSEPVIASVSNAANGQPGVSPGTYVAIYGLNFAPPGFVDDWGKSVIGGKLPTTLDGVSVSIGGQPAYIQAVTEKQINVFTPNLVTGSPLSVTVTTTAGTSTPFTAAVRPVEPALFAWPASQPVATHIDYS
ncbi:MAG TPA: right-handed parallel beta-helix repeat-containing protein, partial [Bryobacteraceae bacterium]